MNEWIKVYNTIETFACTLSEKFFSSSNQTQAEREREVYEDDYVDNNREQSCCFGKEIKYLLATIKRRSH